MKRKDLQARVAKAVRQFWLTREQQASKQGSVSGRKDAGARSAVTGGAQMDGFVELLRELLEGVGVPPSSIHRKQQVELPGWFRAEKSWDVIVVLDERLIASIEFKSQIGPSFGNNFNNRTEEALGSATDLWAAYREGIFKPSARPWLGYLMLLEEAPASSRAVRVQEPHFEVFPEFKDASYMRRYDILLTKLVRERLYDSACLLVSNRTSGPKGSYREPNPELAISRFAESLIARAVAAVQTT